MKEEKKLSKEEKKIAKQDRKANKKTVDKMQLATRIIALIMALLMILGIGASFLYYFLKIV